MKQNVGGLDSAIRAMIALALLIGAGASIRWPGVSAACVLVSLLLAWTALTARCPLYALLDLDSRGRDTGGRSGSAARPHR